jgi:hypothetical protein
MQAARPAFVRGSVVADEPQLPVITGLNVYQLQPGHRVESPQVQAALAIDRRVRPFADGGAGGFAARGCRAPEVVVATTGQGSEITFGLDNLEQQLRRWRGIYDLGQSKNKIDRVGDLAVANNVPVRWMERAPRRSRRQKSVNPVKHRRKNV